MIRAGPAGEGKCVTNTVLKNGWNIYYKRGRE